MPSSEHVALQRNGHHTDLPNSASSRDAHPHSERGQGDQIRSTSIGEFTAKDRIPAQQRTGSAQRPHARSLVADDQLCALARTVASQPRLRISLTSTLSGTVPYFRPYDTHQDDMLDAAVLRDHLNSQQGSSVGVDAVEEGDGLSLVSSSRRLSAQRLSNAMDLSQLHNSINEELLHISGSSSAFSTFLDRDQSVKSISDTALYIGQPPSTRERRLHRREQQDGRVAEESLAEPLPRNVDDDDKSDESRRTEPPLDTSPSPSPEPTNADKNQSVIVEVFQEKRQNYQSSRETEGLVAPQCSSPEFVPKMGLLDHLPSPSRSAPEYPLVASSSSNITLEPVVGTQSGNPASRSCLRGAQTTAREEEVEVSPPPREAKLKLKRPKKKDLSTAERVARRRKKEKRRRKRLRREAALAAAQKVSIGEVAPPHHLGSTTVMEDPENASDTHASKTGELKRQPSKFVEGLRSHTGRVHAASTPPLVTLVDGGVRRANSIPSPVPPVSPHIDSPVSGSQPFRNRAFGLESSAGDNPNDCDEQKEDISNEQTRAAVSDSAPPSQRTCESGVGGPRKAKETEEVGSDPSLKEDCHHSVSYSSRRLPSESASSARGQTSVRQQDPPDSSSRRDAGSYGSSTSNSPQASTLSARQVSGRVVAGSAAAAVAELRRSAGHSNGPFPGQTQGRSVGRRRSGSQISCCSSCEGSRSVNSPTSIERSPGFPSCPSDSTSGSRSRSNSVGLPQGSRSGSSSRSGFSRSSFTASGSETYSSSTSSSGESVLMDEAIPLKEGCSIPPPALAFTDVAFRISHQHLLAPYAEYAIIHEWNITEGLWGRVETNVVLSPSAFSKGNMRASYHMIDLTRLSCSVVAKRYLKASVEDEQYFDDVSMHSIAGHWARLYNSQKPPKNVKFVPAAVLVLPNRQPPLILAMEPKLDGTFQKYNNNSGYVPPNARWTPQAFSHFTYHYSHRDLMIVDIQGVEDIYTDPQILSPDGEGYGRGNLGFKGMRRFMRSHKCNPVCRALGLPPLGGDREFSRSTTDAAKPMRALKGTAQIEMEKLPPKIYHHTSGNSSSSTIPPYNGSRTEVLDSRPHHVVPPTSTSPFPSLRAQSPVIGTPKLNQPFFTASGSSHVEPASRFLQRFHAVWKDQVNYFSTQATGGGMFGEQPHLSSSPARVMHSYGSNNALSTDGSVGNNMSPVLSIPTPHAMPIIFSSNSPQLQRYQRGSSQVSVSYGSSEASTPRMSGVGGNGNASMMMPRPPTNAALATSNGRGSISRIAQQHSVPAFSAVEEQACARRNVQRK